MSENIPFLFQVLEVPSIREIRVNTLTISRHNRT